MAGVKVEDLTFAYPNSSAPALKGVSFEAGEGEFLLLIGRSGCGKSTLLKHLKPILTPHGGRSGRVLIDGRPAAELDRREQTSRIGFVFQHPEDQLVTDKVWHELAFGLESLGTDERAMRTRVSEMASYFGLDGMFFRKVCELSGGQKQLLNLASVMAMGPDLLLLDEPTSQLDPIAAFDFLSTVKKLNTELGITVIMSEHRLEEAMQFADRVLVMEDGELTVADTPAGTARRLMDNGLPMADAMPTAAKISYALGLPGIAMTVNEGRRALNSLGLKKKLLPPTPVRSRGEKPAFRASEIRFRYERDGEDILKDLDISLYGGEIYGLVGANGAGKSTLLSVISGVKPPYSGKLFSDGARLKPGFSAYEKRISLLSQDPRVLFTRDTVREELVSAADARGTRGSMDRIIDLMEIRDVLERNPYDISGGEQQRAAIAKVLLTEPSVLLLDEPTKGMDAAMKAVFGKKLRALRDMGIAILLVSHDVEFCAEHADRMGFMFGGSIVAENTPREFFRENIFYTTAANRIARDVYENAILSGEVTALAREDLG